MTPARKALGEAVGDPLKGAVKELQKIEKRDATRELAVPKPAKEEQRIFTGSIGITRVPPYDCE